MVKSKGEPKKKHEPIYVIAGKEKSLVYAECEKVLENELTAEQRATGFFNADPAEVSAAQVFDELRTLPFLTEKRVVLVRDADKFVSENRELLERYFDNPCPTGILILTVSSWSARTNLAKKLQSVGKLLSVEQPSRWQLPRRLVQYARDAHDKNISAAAAELLVELAGDELGRLYSEVDKLALFAQDEKSITEQHIESLIGHNRIFNAFAVIDAIIAGDIAQAIYRLRAMFAEDKSAEYTVVGAFAFHFRRMFGAKVLLEKGVGTDEIAERLRIWGDRKSFFAQLRKVSLKQIGTILQQLAATDYAIKKGQAKAEVATEQLVLGLAGR
ncbi:MAG: DNA polymerase III subunit delta [Phycisphaerae bacterium]|nr:DNA polymerase III subunit delta [Phycisphaerae bacterium]MDD5382017.1 DNA polymerase III subunit delta [Phycisphaerae bacterium]